MSDDNKQQELITITKKEYDELVRDSVFLHKLYAAGIDNTDAYQEALLMEEE